MRKTEKRVDFLAFMDDLLAELPQSENIHYHAILDNYCIHKRCDEWLAAHTNVTFILKMREVKGSQTKDTLSNLRG